MSVTYLHYQNNHKDSVHKHNDTHIRRYLSEQLDTDGATDKASTLPVIDAQHIRPLAARKILLRLTHNSIPIQSP
jgi:hypothetical protein